MEIKDYNVMIDGENVFDIRTYDNIQKIATGHWDDYTTGCLLDYAYLKNYYKMIAIHLTKQQALDADPKTILQINFTANLYRLGKKAMFFIIKELKEAILDFLQGMVRIF